MVRACERRAEKLKVVVRVPAATNRHLKGQIDARRLCEEEVGGPGLTLCQRDRTFMSDSWVISGTRGCSEA